MSPNVHRYFLFTSSEEPSLRWLDDVWREAADVEGGEEGPRIHFASVDVATDPALAERFAATAPAVLLFRQRKVQHRRCAPCLPLLPPAARTPAIAVTSSLVGPSANQPSVSPALPLLHCAAAVPRRRGAGAAVLM